MMTDVRVHCVGEIDCRRATRERHDLALRREDVDLIREQVALDMFEKFLGVARLRLNLEQALQPAVCLLLRFGNVELATCLVEPMRRDASFGDAVHVLSANLRL